MKRGPFQPLLKMYPRKSFNGKQRAFQAVNKCNYIYTWLEYSPSIDAAFCFYCRSFKGNECNSSHVDNSFSISGFKS